jgi:hypothetical protein
MGTGGPFPKGKARPGLVPDHSPPSSVSPFPPSASRACSGTTKITPLHTGRTWWTNTRSEYGELGHMNQQFIIQRNTFLAFSDIEVFYFTLSGRKLLLLIVHHSAILQRNVYNIGYMYFTKAAMTSPKIHPLRQVGSLEVNAIWKKEEVGPRLWWGKN